MRIVLYSRVFPPSLGGMERFTEVLAGSLTDQGHEVQVATRSPAPPAFDHTRPYAVLRRPRVAELVGVMRRADVVHVKGLSLRGILAARIAGHRPIVTHAGHQAICPTGLAWTPAAACQAGPRPGPCRSCPSGGPRGRLAVLAHGLSTRAAARNVCISQYLARRLTLPRSTVIYNPVLEPVAGPAPGRPHDDRLVAFAGRLVAEKGVDLLLEAVSRLRGLRLEVAGDGPLRTILAQLARARGIDHRTTFLGRLPLDGVGALYQRAAVVCVPSVWHEPFGYAAAEAMAMERPVVATPNGALPELLEHGRGFLARDATPAAFADALAGALADRQERARVARRARAFVMDRLRCDVIARQYAELYGEVRRWAP